MCLLAALELASFKAAQQTRCSKGRSNMHAQRAMGFPPVKRPHQKNRPLNPRHPQFPYTGKRNISDGWTHTTAHAWTSGFFPGVLWQLYNLTGRSEWRQQAERWTRPLGNLQRDWALQHDFGFVYLPSFGEMWKATESSEAKKQVLAAAEATAWAFNPATNSTRTFEGWDAPGATGKFRCGWGAGGGRVARFLNRVLNRKTPGSLTRLNALCCHTKGRPLFKLCISSETENAVCSRAGRGPPPAAGRKRLGQARP